MSRIYLSSPDVGELEEEAVLAAMRSGWIAPLGPDVDGLERDLCERTDREHAVALASGTAALHLALVSWGVGPGDVVPTSTLTFAATVNAIVYTGATPYFVDADPESGNIDVELLDAALTELLEGGVRVPAVVPVDLLGKCVDHQAVRETAQRHGVRVLSDAAESLGASRRGEPAGSLGDAAVFSFNGNKIMTTSGGGALLTDDADLARHVRFLSTQAREPVAHYEHREVGYNYRLSNLLAALGRAQLSRLDSMLARRRALREVYATRFADVAGVRLLGRDDDAEDNCWLTALVVDPEIAGWSPQDLAARLAADDIESRPLWKPMHRQPVFAGSPSSITGHADRLFDQGLTLPSGSVLGDAEVGRILTAIDDFLDAR
ncbi:DegT/DnrJ/EryC1/StrS family aminotransferase [Aeromicrobium sp.]|uniref:DegT/DnrJ/EryC1/StrS family aminotransferase n=1 Tax=Aeromicrobium sp. TaxID=1871063 RepID=UPI004034F313